MVTLPTTCALFLAASSMVAAFSPSRLAVEKSAIHHLSPSSLRTPTSLLADSSLFPDGNNNNNNSNDFDDFAEFSSTQLASSTSTSNDDAKQQGGRNSDDDGDSFLSSLQSRVQQVQDQSNKLPLMILDTMLPRQILQIQIQHPTLKSLMKHRYRQETRKFILFFMILKCIHKLFTHIASSLDCMQPLLVCLEWPSYQRVRLFH